MALHEGKLPVFVVGAPRSGTTLLAAMLASHSQLSCGPETRFFHFLEKTDPASLLESWPDNAIDFLFSTRLIDPVPEHYKLNRKQIKTYLIARRPFISKILSSLTEQWMVREGKRRWVEKSPEHLMHVYQIRKFFPDSPIIRVIRDPRDVALSMIRTPWGPNDLLEALLLWRKYEDNSGSFFRDDANCYDLYYESLVQSPENELRPLCSFLDENFEEQMLDTSISARSVVTENETWKYLVSKPVDKSRVLVWRRELSSAQNRISEALIGDLIQTYGYECIEQFDIEATVVPSLDLFLQYRESLDSFIEKRTRFWSQPTNNSSHLLIFAGEPDKDGWLRYKRPERYFDALSIIIRILLGKLARKRVYWVRKQDSLMNLGKSGRVLAFALRLLEEPDGPAES